MIDGSINRYEHEARRRVFDGAMSGGVDLYLNSRDDKLIISR